MQREVRFERRLLDGAAALAGQVVDDVITDAFRNFGQAGWPEEFMPKAREIMREYLRESDEWLAAFEARVDPPELQRQPLAAKFFREPFTERDKDLIRTTTERCLAAFWQSDLLRRLLDAGPSYWELCPSGSSPWFYSGSVPVYAKFDFALRMPGKTVLYDWKTGKHRPEEAREQLHTYAAFANATWEVPFDQIRVSAVWLGADPDKADEEPVDEQLVERLKAKWAERHALLKARIEDYGKSGARLFELFPTTGMEKRRCPYCLFRCGEGYKALSSGG
jgi:hypothetical protein